MVKTVTQKITQLTVREYLTTTKCFGESLDINFVFVRHDVSLPVSISVGNDTEL